jgi:hypothetical protein
MQTTIATTTTVHEFDAAAARRGLTRRVVTAIVVTAAALACVVFLAGQADWWRGYAAATVASALAAGLSLIPLHRGLDKGFSALVPAVMAATGVRTLVVVGGCLLAVVAGRYPAAPTLILMLPYYLALLGVETAFLVKLGKK